MIELWHTFVCANTNSFGSMSSTVQHESDLRLFTIVFVIQSSHFCSLSKPYDEPTWKTQFLRSKIHVWKKASKSVNKSFLDSLKHIIQLLEIIENNRHTKHYIEKLDLTRSQLENHGFNYKTRLNNGVATLRYKAKPVYLMWLNIWQTHHLTHHVLCKYINLVW